MCADHKAAMPANCSKDPLTGQYCPSHLPNPGMHSHDDPNWPWLMLAPVQDLECQGPAEGDTC